MRGFQIRRSGIVAFVFIVIMLIPVIFLFGRSHANFAEGEMIIMQGNHSSDFPMYVYNLNDQKLKEIRDVFYDPHYVNNSNDLIAIVNHNDIQEVYDFLEKQGGSYQKNKLLYSGEHLVHPKFIPNRDAISVIQNHQLIFVDRKTNVTKVIANVLYDDYVWLDSNTVLYTNENNDHTTNIMAYHLDQQSTSIYKKNGVNPALSSDRKVIAYQLGKKRNTVYIENVDGTNKKAIHVQAQGILPYQPSSDGKYLLGTVYTKSKADVVLINTTNDKMKTIVSDCYPFTIDWKETDPQNK